MAEQTTPASAPAPTGDAAAAPAAKVEEAPNAPEPKADAKPGEPEAAVEAKPEEKPPEAKPDPAAKSLAELASVQQATRKERQALQKELKAIEEHKAEIEQAKNLLGLAKTDKVAFLKAAGLDPNELLQMFVGGELDGTPAEEKPVNPQIAKLEARILALTEGLQKEKQTEAQKQQDAAWNTYSEQVRGAVSAAGDKFEIINSPVGERMHLHQEVMDLIEGYYRDTGGKVLDAETAASLVEQKAEELLREVPRLKKFAQAKPTENESGSQQTGNKPNTITSQLTAPSGTKAKDERQKLSREESLKRAIAKFTTAAA